MISNPGRVNLALKELGIEFKTDDWWKSFEERKRIQKIIYLLEQIGLNFRYDFKWYLHGPYSSHLADDLYELARFKRYYDQEVKNYRFKKFAKKRIERFKNLFGKKLNDSEWMEIAASLVFLKTHYGKSGKDLVKLFLERKPKFKEIEDKIEKIADFIEQNWSIFVSNG